MDFVLINNVPCYVVLLSYRVLFTVDFHRIGPCHLSPALNKLHPCTDGQISLLMSRASDQI